MQEFREEGWAHEVRDKTGLHGEREVKEELRDPEYRSIPFSKLGTRQPKSFGGGDSGAGSSLPL